MDTSVARPLTEIELAFLGIAIASAVGFVFALRRAWALPRTDGARELALVVCFGLLVLAVGSAMATWADGELPDLRNVGAALARGSLLVIAAYLAVWGIRGSFRRR